MHERLVRYITEFEADLSDEEEVGGRLVNFGADTTFHIDDISYHGPDLLMFYGVGANEKRLMLLQHVSQVSVLLVALPKSGEKAKRIGFRLSHQAQQPDDSSNQD